ncbi:alpha/beta hydrolase family protein [Oleiharenicola lentus]|uniref:alpha/beta hydrolase family protein n=1 Tax=Oleiharenicola lentus TaxID=2508720 RepID=UPI003F6733EC
MKLPRIAGFLAVITLGLPSLPVRAEEALAWLPVGFPVLPAEGLVLCQRDYLTEAQGKAVLDAAGVEFSSKEKWDAYAALLRDKVQRGAGLTPWPKRTPLNAIIHSRRDYDGYSVENVALETIPGYFLTGNLFRPLGAKGLAPAILTTQGHAGTVKQPSDYAKQGRFTDQMQFRAATLARMGAVVLTVDMFGCGDSIPQVGQESHRNEITMTIQTWSNIRAVDFLAALPGVDPQRIGVTGASGGGTQAFLLTALDPRVAVSAPVAMVSAYFFGGCPCESGRPIHRSAEHFANNAMLTALTAPRPLHLISDGGDWTKNTPDVEFPFLQKIYALQGAEKNVSYEHFAKEGHDYGPNKRQSMYRFMAMRLGLNAKIERNAAGLIDESQVTVEPPEKLHVFNEAHPLPAHALRSAEAVRQTLQTLQTP